MNFNRYVTVTSLEHHLSLLGVSPFYQSILREENTFHAALLKSGSIPSYLYFWGLKNLFSTITEVMAREHAHLLAFDLYNCRVFRRYDIYKTSPLSEMDDFLDNMFIHSSLFELDEPYHHCREAFHLASRMTAYLYRDKLSALSACLVLDKGLSFDRFRKILQKGSVTPQKRAYGPILTRLRNTELMSEKDPAREKAPLDWEQDNYLYVLANKTKTGIVDKFLTNKKLSSEEGNITRPELENDVFISRQKATQVVSNNDKIDGIRRMKSEQDLTRLLPSQYAYFDSQDLFLYLFAHNKLLTYNIPANVVSHKHILVSFIDIINMNSGDAQFPFPDYPIFYNNLSKTLHLKTFYEFLKHKQSKLFKPIFEDNFEFTYRFVHLGKYDILPEDIREKQLRLTLSEQIEYEDFRTGLVVEFPLLFYYDDFHKPSRQLHDRLEYTFKKMLKEENVDIWVTILYFQGFDHILAKVHPKLPLKQFVSYRSHIITIEPCEGKSQFEIQRLLNRRQLPEFQTAQRVPFYAALEGIKAIIMP